MAAKNIDEAIEMAMYRANGSEFKRVLKGELRDLLAHSVARFCLRHKAMKDYDILTQFIQEIVRDFPYQPEPNMAQEMLDQVLETAKKAGGWKNE